MFDDEKLTVFHGGKDKTAARSMLDAVTDRNSFSTRIEYDAGQGVTRMLRTKGGRPEVTTTKINGGDDTAAIGLVAKFFSTPSSKSYPAGYVPSGGYAGPFSEWRRWPGKTTPPAAEIVGSGSRLRPVAPLSSDVPGTITWFSDNFMIGDDHIVLSWRGNNLRHGVYGGELTEPSINDWTNKPSNKTDFKFDADCHGRSSDFRARVWLSDTLWVNTGVLVWSAGLRDVSGETYLYVISQSGIYKAPLKVTSLASGKRRLNQRIHDSTLEMESVGSFSGAVSHLSQMPFINSSCTKAVLFTTAKGFDDTPLAVDEAAPWNIAEVDLDSSAVTPVFTNTYTVKTPDVVATLTGDSSAGALSVIQSPHDMLHRETAWAADYQGDMLVYLFERHTVHVGNGSFAATRTVVFPAGARTITASTAIVSDTYEVVHSVLGSVVDEFAADTGAVTRVISGATTDGTEATSSVTSSIDADAHSLRIVKGALINADLRHDTFMFTYQKNDYLTTGNYSGVHPGREHSLLHDELWTSTAVYQINRGAAVLQKIEHPVGDGGSFQVGGVGLAGFFDFYGDSSGPASAAATATEYKGFTYSFVHDQVDGDTELVCADVAHIATSPDGKAAYVALNWPTTDTETGVDVMLFVLEGVTTIIPSSTYCPGPAPCLAGAIFYPKILDDL